MWIELSKRKNLLVLETSLSCFGPFGVWGVTYSVGVVQGEDVISALNAPTNILATLMGKDF